MRTLATALGAAVIGAVLGTTIGLPAGAAVPGKPGPRQIEKGNGPIHAVSNHWCVTAARLKTKNSSITASKCIKGDQLQIWHITRAVPGGYTVITLTDTGGKLCLGQREAAGLWTRLVDCTGDDDHARYNLVTSLDHDSWIVINPHMQGQPQLTSPAHFDPRTKNVKLYWKAGGASTEHFNQHWLLPPLHQG